MPNEVWTEGCLQINGVAVETQVVRRMREGGATEIVTQQGTLYCHRRIRHYDEWEGERLLPESPKAEADAHH